MKQTKVQTYGDMTVELMQATPYPAEMVGLALSIVMKSDITDIIPSFTTKLAKFIHDAEHASVVEHVIYTFLLSGVSRSFLAQITRQRTASPTSGSQHYQDYQDYPCTVRPDASPEVKQLYQEGFDNSFYFYSRLIAAGEPKEEARQVLPNGATVNYLWTIDARNLALFLRQRLCYRNVSEMQVFAEKVYAIVVEHFPEWFGVNGPQCVTGGCKQGYLYCGKGPWNRP